LESRLSKKLGRNCQALIPAAIVSISTGKYQVLWRVENIPFEQQQEVLRKLLAITFRCAPACPACNRVLHLPGFLNQNTIRLATQSPIRERHNPPRIGRRKPDRSIRLELNAELNLKFFVIPPICRILAEKLPTGPSSLFKLIWALPLDSQLACCLLARFDLRVKVKLSPHTCLSHLGTEGSIPIRPQAAR
jgi:hypothetical protein